jgi:crotonobetainyl-CoA:carnitine CoA-transferase CaiB-like acyl-CoA transferase
MPDRMLEIGDFAAGYCGRLFAHTGHDVVRIEPATPAPGWVGQDASDLYLHAGKRRIRTQDPGLIAELAREAQVVVVEAATADELVELGFDAWQTPVKVAITPFGRTGPKRNWRATPNILLAMGGYTQLMGDPDRPPLSLPGHYLEFQAGQYAYVAAHACRLAGESAAIDIGMFETLMSLSQFTTVQWFCKGEIRSRHGNDLWAVCPSNLYRLRDGAAYVNIVPAFWDAFTIFIDRPELLVDERFANNDRRMAHRDALHATIAQAMADMTRSDVVDRAEALRIPAGVIQSLDEILADPQLAARDFWQALESRDGITVRSPTLPWRVDAVPYPTPLLREPEHDRG